VLVLALVAWDAAQAEPCVGLREYVEGSAGSLPVVAATRDTPVRRDPRIESPRVAVAGARRMVLVHATCTDGWAKVEGDTAAPDGSVRSFTGWIRLEATCTPRWVARSPMALPRLRALCDFEIGD